MREMQSNSNQICINGFSYHASKFLRFVHLTKAKQGISVPSNDLLYLTLGCAVPVPKIRPGVSIQTQFCFWEPC